VLDWVAFRVKVVVSIAEWANVPITVPLVKGDVRTRGEPILSVLVMFALDGVIVYVALNVGLVIDVPSSTVSPPVKLVILNVP